MFIRCFLSDHVQSVKVDGKRSHPVDVVPSVPQGSVLGLSPLLFLLLYTVDLPFLLENTLLAYSYDFTLFAKVPRPMSEVVCLCISK